MTEPPRITELNVPEMIDTHATRKIEHLDKQIERCISEIVDMASEKIKLEIHHKISQAMK